MPATLPCGCPVDHGQDIRTEFIVPDKSNLKLSDNERLGNVVQLLNQPQVFIEPPNCQEVVKGLFVGPLSAVSSTLLKKHAIGRIVTFEDLPAPPEGVEVLRVHAEDRADEAMNFVHLIPGCVQFMCKQQDGGEELKALGANVLVVSRYGLSRAPALCVGFLIAKFKYTPNSAWAKLREIRSWIKPNRSLVLQTKWFYALGCNLENFGSMLHAKFRNLNFAYHYKHSILSSCFPPLHTISALPFSSATTAVPLSSADTSCFSLAASSAESPIKSSIDSSLESASIESPITSSSPPSSSSSFFASPSVSTSSFLAPPTCSPPSASSSLDDVFCCKCCGGPVMQRKHIVPSHFAVVETEEGVEVESDRSGDDSHCNYYHVEPMQWMTSCEDPVVRAAIENRFPNHHRCLAGLDLSLVGQFAFQRAMLTSGQAHSIADYRRGPLLCPACCCPLGWFNWDGSRCSCQYLEKPAFQVAKSRVVVLSENPCVSESSMIEESKNGAPTPQKQAQMPIVLHFGIRNSLLKFKSRKSQANGADAPG